MKITGIVLMALAAPGLILGLIWLIVFYGSQGAYPLAMLGALNLVIGGALLVSGLLSRVSGVAFLVAGSTKRPVTPVPGV